MNRNVARWLAAASIALACGDSADGEPVCEAGRQVACDCAGGLQGFQICLSDGSGFDACACPELECTTAGDCDDADACTVDTCEPGGSCKNEAISVDDGNLCTDDGCDPRTGQVWHVARAEIDDGNACTQDDCNPATGQVTHTLLPVVDDDDVCTLDGCDPLTGAPTHTAIDIDDGDDCTLDTCDPTTGVAHTPIVYFSEDFSGGASGWLLGYQWEIGPATASPPVPGFGVDPDQDHSPTGDDMILGTLLGGPMGDGGGSAQYAEKTPVDIGPVSTPVYLELWRVLNAANDDSQHVTLQVFDTNAGAWVTLFTNGNANIAENTAADPGWKRYAYDVTDYVGPGFAFRFGYTIYSTSGNPPGGWNIDDIRLVPGPDCP